MAHVYRDGLNRARLAKSRGRRPLVQPRAAKHTSPPRAGAALRLVAPSNSKPTERSRWSADGNRQIGIPWIVNGQRNARAGQPLVDRWQPVARVPRRDYHHYACSREAILAGDKTFEFRRLPFGRPEGEADASIPIAVMSAEGFWDQPSASVVLLSRSLPAAFSRPQVLTQVGGATPSVIATQSCAGNCLGGLRRTRDGGAETGARRVVAGCRPRALL
jgi:hypothetical protein